MLKVALLKRRDGFTLDANFEAPTPGVVALFGRSGCGKTTVVNIIAGLLEADEARIELDGTVLEDKSTHVPPERRRIGYVFQDGRLFPHMTVLRNLRYGMTRVNPRNGSNVSGQLIGMEQIVTLLGLERLLSRRPHQLSGGEKQRVSLGRALLSQPRMLLLDEPLAALDTARRDEVLPYLERLRDNFSIPMIYVSHQFDEVLRLATYC
jgi:molybdate transport system ATP-binding protein